MKIFFNHILSIAVASCLFVGCTEEDFDIKQDGEPDVTPDFIGDHEGDSVTNLSADGTANCYIAGPSASFCFKATVKGNSDTALDGTPHSAVTLWETFNTADAINAGDLIKDVQYSDGYITFSTSDQTGNALIAVKDTSGIVLWSWHIWITDYNPSTEYDVYKDHDGVKVMDRNLGAMSSEPGDGAFGLIYQWGRKDPFMGHLGSSGDFVSTCDFPACVTTDSTFGTDQYASENPTQYILALKQNLDWRNNPDDEAWSSSKTVNDPCPKGWRVPDGGSDGLWSGFPSSYDTGCSWDSTNSGMSYTTKYSSRAGWYPAQGYHGDSKTYYSGFWQVGIEGRYWTTHTLGSGSDYMTFQSSRIEIYHTDTAIHFSRANGCPVRCCSE